MKLPGLAGPSLNPPANFLNPAAERTLQGLFGAFGPLSTVQVVGDVYLDVIAKIDATANEIPGISIRGYPTMLLFT